MLSLYKRLTQHQWFRLSSVMLCVAIILLNIWLLPIQGKVIIVTDSTQHIVGIWPKVWTDPVVPHVYEPILVYIRDTTPWSYIKLLVDGVEVPRDETFESGTGPWTWRWRATLSNAQNYTVVFYHSCNIGCIERIHITLGDSAPQEINHQLLEPTKLGAVFANSQRDWHNRAGWTIELTYIRRQDDVDFSIDGLAQRTWRATNKGLRVLVRIAYDRSQALPPSGDEVALKQFLDYCARLAHDERLNNVYGYVIGAGFNTNEENVLAPSQPTTPDWYARVFNGYGLEPTRKDNVVQTMRLINSRVRIFVGPVAPWRSDQGGILSDPHHLPWLDYMNTLVAYIDVATRAHEEYGISLAGPDGFALRAPGRVDAVAMTNQQAKEPSIDIHRTEWGSAQAGFRVYQDWLAIINRYSTTRGLPAYITSTNIVTSETKAPPTQTYPRGWLTNALNEINQEPQIKALCWFVDESLGGVWDNYSLDQHPGALNDAAEEFDQLLKH